MTKTAHTIADRHYSLTHSSLWGSFCGIFRIWIRTPSLVSLPVEFDYLSFYWHLCFIRASYKNRPPLLQVMGHAGGDSQHDLIPLPASSSNSCCGYCSVLNHFFRSKGQTLCSVISTSRWNTWNCHSCTYVHHDSSGLYINLLHFYWLSLTLTLNNICY